MAQKPMFAAINNSIPTMTSGLLSATATTIDVENGGVLPAGPNLLTLGTEDNAELVYYTAVSGNRATGCVRGYNGTAKQIWPAGTIVYRAYTAVDHQTFIDNINDLEAGKLSATADLAESRVTFKPVSYFAGLISGEKLSTALSKINKWYDSFGDPAFSDFGTEEETVAEGNHTHDTYVPLDTSGKAAAQAIAARGIKVTASRTLALSDAGCCLDVDSTAAVEVRVPHDATVAFPVDTEIEVSWEGTGSVKLTCEGGVALTCTRGEPVGGIPLATRYAVAVLRKKGPNRWRVTGELS